jgi:hypothetical protein
MLERGRKPGDLILFQTVLLPGLGVARMAHPGTILFLAKQGGQSGGLVDSGRELPVESALFSMGIRMSSLGDAKPAKKAHTFRRSLQVSSLGWVECALACRREARPLRF